MKNILFTAVLFFGLSERNAQAQWVQTNGPFDENGNPADIRELKACSNASGEFLLAATGQNISFL